jgi:hypothetical protein
MFWSWPALQPDNYAQALKTESQGIRVLYYRRINSSKIITLLFASSQRTG